MRRSIRVAIIGVGNCASSLVQAVTAAKDDALGAPGLAHRRVGPYAPADIDVVAAFDVDRRKVGRDVAEAIVAMPNCTTSYVDVPALGVTVDAGPLEDGVGSTTSSIVELHDDHAGASTATVAAALRCAAADVAVSYLPTGARRATEAYAEACLEAGVAFVNCNPEPIATDAGWQARFVAAGVPVLGDDIRSQLGATRLHRVLLDLCREVGAVVGRTYQLNFGGNNDFLNMLDPDRAASKKRTKGASVRELLTGEARYSAGPSGYVEFLDDHKVAYIRVEGELLLGMPFSLETRLEVEDSPNSAGVVLDACRAAKLAVDRGVGGAVPDPCGYLFKLPPVPCRDDEAHRRFLAFAAAQANGDADPAGVTGP